MRPAILPALVASERYRGRGNDVHNLDAVSDEKPKRRFVAAGLGNSKFVLETQAQADLREAGKAPTDSATVTALRAKVAELEKRIAEADKCELLHGDDGDSGD